MRRILRYEIVLFGLLFCISICANDVAIKTSSCKQIGQAGFIIEKAGRYCIIKDLQTRWDFADHPAEHAIVEIRSSHVQIDMQGHTVSTAGAWIFRQHIGNAFKIEGSLERVEDIIIKNGTVAYFETGFFFYASQYGIYQVPPSERTLTRVAEATFVYEPANITIENIKFREVDTKFHFMDWISK